MPDVLLYFHCERKSFYFLINADDVAVRLFAKCWSRFSSSNALLELEIEDKISAQFSLN
jgi:hypothetical protein